MFFKKSPIFRVAQNCIYITPILVSIFVLLSWGALNTYSRNLQSTLCLADLLVFLTMPREYNFPIILLLLYITYKQCSVLERSSIKVRYQRKSSLLQAQCLIILKNTFALSLYIVLFVLGISLFTQAELINWSSVDSYFYLHTRTTSDMSFFLILIYITGMLFLSNLMVCLIYIVLYKCIRKSVPLLCMLSFIYFLEIKDAGIYFNFFSCSYRNIISEITIELRFLLLALIILFVIFIVQKARLGDEL